MTHPRCFEQMEPSFEATAIVDGGLDCIDKKGPLSPNIWIYEPVSITVDRDFVAA